MVASAAKIAFGSTLKWNTKLVAELTKIGDINISAKTADITSFDSDDAFEEVIPTILSGNSFDIEGFLIVGDTDGQVAMLADELSKTMREWIITYPAAVAATWTGNGYVTNVKLGGMTIDGVLTFSATITNTGKPVLGITLAGGLTTTFFAVVSTAGGDTITPAPAAAVYEYNVSLGAGATTYHITPISTTATSIVIRDSDGNDQTVLTGADSTEIAAPIDGMETVYIICKETGKANKTYTLHVGEPV